MLNALSDSSASVREESVEWLGDKGYEKAIKRIMQLLKDDNKWVRDKAVKTLGKLGVSPDDIERGRIRVDYIAELKKEAESQNHSTRSYAFSTLDDMTIKRARDALIDLLLKSSLTVSRDDAASALEYSTFSDRKTIDALIYAMEKDPEWSVRYRSASALGNKKDPSSVGPLIKALRDRKNVVRTYAATSLGKIGDRQAVEPLIELLKDPDEGVVASARKALKKLGVSADEIRSAGFSPREQLQLYMAKTKNSFYLDESLRKNIIGLMPSVIPPPVLPEESHRLMTEGKVAFRMGDYDEAEEKLRKASNLAPWWADAYYNLGLVFKKNRNLDDAVKCFNLYLLAAPGAKDAASVKEQIYEMQYKKKRYDEAGLHIDMGNEHLNSSRYEDAIAEFNKALRLDQDYDLVHYNLGVALNGLERYKEAILEFDEAIRLGFDLHAYIGKAYAYARFRDYKKAISIIEEGIRKKPFGIEKAHAHNNLGYYYEMTGNYRSALKNYELARELGYTGNPDLDGIIRKLKQRKL